MNKLEQQEESKDIEILKSSIGFKTAFKATMGFYVAQLVATVAGLIVFGILAVIGFSAVAGIIYYFGK